MHVIPRGLRWRRRGDCLLVLSRQSPVVSAAIARLHKYSNARRAMRLGVLSSVSMLLLLVDM